MISCDLHFIGYSMRTITFKVGWIITTLSIPLSQTVAAEAIDRHAVVSRHDVTWADPTGPMPLGNGNFAFNADGTGLQTFAGNTMSHWAWHSFSPPPGITPEMRPPTGTFQQGHPTAMDPRGPSKALSTWMLLNPHKFNLGRLRLRWADGRDVDLKEISDLRSHVELWTGLLDSTFKLAGETVHVQSCVHPSLDAIGVRIESPLLANRKLGVGLDFPFPKIDKSETWQGDFSEAAGHQTVRSSPSPNVSVFDRHVDDFTYHAALNWSAGALAQAGNSPHQFLLNGINSPKVEITLCYSLESIKLPLPAFDETRKAVVAHWESFWESGGAIDLSQSKDPRWKELERRIVLSQFHLAAQSAGDYPPSEAGLTIVDKWGSRFHMEMIWWHLAHFALWDRWPMAQKALTIYDHFLEQAKARAAQIGVKGALWPKATAPDGTQRPWGGNVILLWKQPHPLFFAELDYRLHPNNETLRKWNDVVHETAECMADYATFDPATGHYILKPCMPPSEQGQGKMQDGVFDLAYWRYGLDIAQNWRERQGQPREPHWDEVRKNLSPLPMKDGVYLLSPDWPDTYTKYNRDHPDLVGVLGMLPPTEAIDADVVRRSLDKTLKEWQWANTWGWDQPWTAMCAARLGKPSVAVDALLMDVPHNQYDWRGVNLGGPCPYLPGNGGVLYAVAMMAAGWDGAPDHNAPGFPNDGSWVVKWEGLKKAP